MFKEKKYQLIFFWLGWETGVQYAVETKEATVHGATTPHTWGFIVCSCACVHTASQCMNSHTAVIPGEKQLFTKQRWF